MPLFQAIASGDPKQALRLLKTSPELAHQPIPTGATRGTEQPYFLTSVGHWIYAGDTALHVAAAAYRVDLADALVARGAALGARNRRGAEPLHYAADGNPASPYWNPDNQAATIAFLIRAGADPNACNMDGVTPLHRAVRTRCAAAVRALLEGGADPRRTNDSGSTPLDLATRTTGRGGSGLPAARAQQAQIIELLSS